MRNAGLFLTVLLTLGVIHLAYAQTPNLDADPAFEAKFEQLMTSVYCYCGCTRETIQQCVCGTAQQIEAEFRRRLAAGETVEQIRNDYLAVHGPQYSALMPAKGFNLVAYIMPGVIIVLLGIIVFLVIKSKRQQPVEVSGKPVINRITVRDLASGKPVEVSADDNRYKQIEEELERHKRER